MELRRMFRSAVAIVLAASMLSSISAGAVASVVTTPEGVIEGERLTGEYAPEGNAVYFGANTVAVDEEKGIYYARLYREGDLSGTATVTIRSFDVSASYGEDYDLPDADTVIGSTGTYLERSAQEQAEPEAVTGSATVVTDDPAGLADGTAGVALTDVRQGAAAVSDSGKSGLAQEKEEQTGLPTRETAESVPVVNSPLTDAILGEVVPQYMQGMDYSAEQIITFAPGESEQDIAFRILDDKQSEGTEGFSLMIVDAEGAEPYTNISLSVAINDDEPVVHSALSFSKGAYRLQDGSVTVTVKREGAEYSIATAVLTATDTDGNVITQGEVAFAPYVNEQEITLALSGAAELKLDGFTAAEPGRITEASVTEPLAFFPVFAQENPVASLAADGEQNFSIKMAGKSYKVVFRAGELTGRVMDESYTPALEVGTYFFPMDTGKNGMMTYDYSGDDPGVWGWRHHDYKTEGTKIWVQLEYYSGWVGDEGSAYALIELRNSKIDADYYRKIIPDWAQDRYAYGGQKSSFNVYFNHDASGTSDGSVNKTDGNKVFERETKVSDGIEVKGRTGRITYRAAAVDSSSGMTPKLRLCFYGAVALYKKYAVTTANPAEKTFLSGGSTVSALPVQFRVKCGAQTLSDREARDLYVNLDEDASNIVFTLQPNEINGVASSFGVLTGYSITVTPNNKEKKVVVNYPADFISFISSKAGQTVAGGADYSQSGIQAETKKITGHLDTIPMDKYFIEWIESVQKDVDADSLGYCQSLLITPQVDYNNVQVRFVAPDGGAAGRGHFKNTAYAAGTESTFHAGDMLDLSGVSDDPSWRIVGYDVSTNGGITYTTVRDTYNLVLMPNKDYIVRPAVAENDNCIEIEFADEAAAANLSIFGNLIPQSELPAELKGKNILNLNPDAATVMEKMRPELGRAYNLDILVSGTAPSGKVYRPVIHDNMLDQDFNGQRYYFNARIATTDNRFTVRLETVDASSVKEYSVDGYAMVSLPAIRNDSLGKHSTPATGYTVLAAAEQGTMKSGGKEIPCVMSAVSSVEPDSGVFHLSGVPARAGDRISVLLDNGYNDAQAAQIVLGRDTSCAAGVLNVTYPFSAPEVVSLTYSYDNPDNMHKVDLRDNSVRAFDDTLNLTAVVDLKGRIVKEAVFTATTVTGQTITVKGQPTAPGGNVFTAQFPKMLDRLHNGDRISVYLVDAESRTITVGSEQQNIDIAYPTVETGLVIYVENELIAPKDFSAETSIPLKIPLMGDAASSVKSGQMGFSRLNWPDKMGFTLTINADVFGTNKGSKSTEDLIKDKTNFVESVQKYNRAQTEMAEAGRSLEAASAALADDVINNEGGRQKEFQDRIRESGEALRASQEKAEANDPKAKFTKDAKIDWDVFVCVALDFVYNPAQKEYQLARFAITIGGSFNISKTWYAMMGYVPCFLNLSGGAQANLIFGNVLERGANAVSQSEFNKYTGNIRNLLGTSGFQFEGDIVLKGKVQIGCGMCGVLSARGYISVQLMFQALYGAQAALAKHNLGFATDIAGGIGFDFVLMSVNINVARVKVGVGTLDSVGKISFLGDLVETGYEPAAKTAGIEETVTVTPYSSGTSDMSSFGQAATVASQPIEVSRLVLLDNAADRTRSRLLQLPEGRAMLIFLGSAERDEADDSCLYYALRDRHGLWGEPIPVDDDGTYDSMPDAIVHDGQVILAWMDASESFAGMDDFHEKFNTFNISAAAYDIASDTMGRAVTLVSNPYFCGYPSLCAVEDHIDCVYMNRDISTVASEEELLNFEGTYSTMAHVSFSPERLRPGQFDNAPMKEQFIVIRHENLTDPVVVDYSRTALDANGYHLFASVYTLDLDADYRTASDREVYLSFYDADSKVDYYPIRLTANDIDESNPQLTDLGEAGVYATWVNEKGEFCLLNAGDLAEALFADGVKLGDPDYPDWFHISKAPDNADTEDFDKSIYAEMARGEFRVESTALVEDGSVSLDEYQLATDGKDVYIFFVAPNPDWDSTGTDLYAMRYRRGTGSDMDNAAGEYGDESFTTAVAITGDDEVIDEFSLYITKGRQVQLVSNAFTQSLNDDGEIVYSPNRLTNISFIPAGSIGIVPGSLQTEEYLVPGMPAQVSFTVRNNGLFPAEKWEYSLTYDNGGKKTVIAEGTSDVVLDSGDTCTVNAAWDVPENISGNSITASVAERNVLISIQDHQTLSLDGSADLEADFLVTMLNDDGTLGVMASVFNRGNGDAAAFDQVLYDVKDPSHPVELAREHVSGLGSGMTDILTADIPLTPENFDDFGLVSLKYVLERSGEELAFANTLFTTTAPVLAGFDAESLSLDAGKTASVSAFAAPWSEIAGDVQYVSADPTVASVNKDTGAVTAVAAGRTVITAVFPDTGLTAELPVTVTGETPKPVPDDDHGGGGSVKPVTPPAPPAPVEPEGTFIDVPADAYYAEPIAWAVENGITNGTGEKTFSPDMTCTRAQMVTFLWRAAGSPVLADMTAEGPAYVNPFEDVSRDAYYYDAVKWAVLEGITKGTSESTFSPNDTVTRGQTVTFLWRAAGSPKLLNMTAEGPAWTNPFTDVSTEDYYYDAVQWAAAKEITKGTSDTTFSPAAGCTRAQIVTFLYRTQ